jgi:hypothetical protein
MQGHDYQRALAWVHVALLLDPHNPAAHHNLEDIGMARGRPSWPKGFQGTYVRYAGKGQWDSLCVSEQQKRSISFQLLAYRMGSAWEKYGPASYGDLGGPATLKLADEATYSGDKDFPGCRVEMKFNPDSVGLKQDGECGFGYGVQASGVYERINAGDQNRCDEHEFTNGP